MTTIRPARRDDLERLQGIERAAGRLFHDVGLHAVAEDEPPGIAELERHLADDGVLVAEWDGEVAGYVLVSTIDGETFVDQLSVDPAYGRRGIGGALLEAACHLARSRGHGAVTLTTFSGVPWNEPYYAARGFVVVPVPALTPGLVAVRAEETARGLDPRRRVVMRRALAAS